VRDWNIAVVNRAGEIKMEDPMASAWRASYVIGTQKDRDEMEAHALAQARRDVESLSPDQIALAEEAEDHIGAKFHYIRNVNTRINDVCKEIYKVRGELNRALATIGKTRAEVKKLSK
jgi:hypothetical protein